MSWLSLVLTLLKIASQIMSWARERELITQGHDQAIAEATRILLLKTEAGKKMMEKVNAMSDAEVDASLRGLEPK